MKPPHEILKRPLVTEKTVQQEGEAQVVAFEVKREANKVEIKKAVEQAFEVKVKNVNTVLVAGKVKRLGRTYGKRSNRKRAYGKLSEARSINLLTV